MTKKDTSLDDIAESISALTSMVSEKFDEVDKRLDSNDKRFDAIDKRFDSIDKRFDANDHRVNSMESRFDRIDATLAEHTSMIRDLQVSNVRIATKLDDIEGRLLALEEDIKEMYLILDRYVLGKKLSGRDKRSLEVKLTEAYQNILQIAKEANVKLPK